MYSPGCNPCRARRGGRLGSWLDLAFDLPADGTAGTPMDDAGSSGGGSSGGGGGGGGGGFAMPTEETFLLPPTDTGEAGGGILAPLGPEIAPPIRSEERRVGK